MANPPVPLLGAPASRAEKMSILSAMLGPEALARLREGQADAPARPSDASVAIDADRAAWHRNKLLERLRDQVRAASKPKSTASAQVSQSSPRPSAAPREPVPTFDRGPGRSLDMRLAAIADLETLGDEHPAIITRLVRSLSREERVAVLKSLPGPVARSVVKRLR